MHPMLTGLSSDIDKLPVEHAPPSPSFSFGGCVVARSGNQYHLDGDEVLSLLLVIFFVQAKRSSQC